MTVIPTLEESFFKFYLFNLINKTLKPQYILFWASGLCFGLMIGAYIACPYWKIAVPVMFLLSLAAARIGVEREKRREE